MRGAAPAAGAGAGRQDGASEQGECEGAEFGHGRLRHLSAEKVAVAIAFPSVSAPVAPDDIVRTPAEGQANSRPPLLVLDPLEAFLDAHGLGAGEIAASPIGEGHSNVTYLIERGGERVRAAPPAAPAAAAERARRAARGAPAARAARTRPRACRTCSRSATTRRSIGAPFYVMERDRGRGDRRERARARSTRRPSARRIGEELIDALVEIHAVDWRAAGLEGFGKPTGYLERQLRRFLGLWELNKTREIPAVESVGELARREPARAPARRRSCTATSASATRSSRRGARRAWRRCSTGRWRRSATRSPTSATCA